jgi:hypothetical protein
MNSGSLTANQTFSASAQTAQPAQPTQPSRRLSPLLKAVWRDMAPTLHLMHRSGFRLPF